MCAEDCLFYACLKGLLAAGHPLPAGFRAGQDLQVLSAQLRELAQQTAIQHLQGLQSWTDDAEWQRIGDQVLSELQPDTLVGEDVAAILADVLNAVIYVVSTHEMTGADCLQVTRYGGEAGCPGSCRH